MADVPPPKAISDAVTNIRETTKWIVVALGAAFSLALGGTQLSSLGFDDLAGPGLMVWGALVASVAAFVATLWLAIGVLIAPGITADQLNDKKRFRRLKRYVNSQFALMYPGRPDVYGDSLAAYKSVLRRRAARGTHAAADPVLDGELQAAIESLTQSVNLALWQYTLRRFEYLRAALVVLIPIAVIAAVIFAAHTKHDKPAANPKQASGSQYFVGPQG
jgi:hypothetical protein